MGMLSGHHRVSPVVKRIILTATTGILLFASVVTLAQGFRGLPTSGPGAYASPNARFEIAPDIGEAPPDVEVVDRNGNPVSIRDITRENYTVLVLGCLT